MTCQLQATLFFFLLPLKRQRTARLEPQAHDMDITSTALDNTTAKIIPVAIRQARAGKSALLRILTRYSR
jgi:hypothetical protein